MERSVLLASSAISSSAGMQRLISSQSGVSGSISVKNPVSESSGTSSFSERENAFTRLAASKREQIESSSAALKEAPISKRFS